jgi:MFS family permease
MGVENRNVQRKTSFSNINKMSPHKPIIMARAGKKKAGQLRWWILGLLVLAMVISYIDRGNISMVAPIITDLFKLSPEKKGYIFSAFLFGYALMQIPSGIIVDRLGFKWTYAVAFFIWCLAFYRFTDPVGILGVSFGACGQRICRKILSGR